MEKVISVHLGRNYFFYYFYIYFFVYIFDQALCENYPKAPKGNILTAFHL